MPNRAQQFAQAILRWFAKNGRDLPWRKTRDPYKIWVSEIMLQQTQVDRVIDYYHRFLKSFPTVRYLAKAEWDDVLVAWQGLGYYRRARNMMRTAKAVAEEHGGRFPTTVEELEKLPGIGPYTARAIGVFAYERDLLVLDTNTSRILSRIFGITGKDLLKAVAENARNVVPEGRSWDFHQGLMDFGSAICTAKQPKCGECMMKAKCRYAKDVSALLSQARREHRGPIAASGPWRPRPAPRAFDASGEERGGSVAHESAKGSVRQALPDSGVRKHPMIIDVAVAIIHRSGKILITRRPKGSHLAGLWEFPGGKREGKEDWRACLKREIREELGLDVAVRPHDWSAEFAYEDRIVKLRFHRCSILKGVPKSEEGQELRWIKPLELDRYTFPPANARVIEKIMKARFVDPHK